MLYYSWIAFPIIYKNILQKYPLIKPKIGIHLPRHQNLAGFEWEVLLLLEVTLKVFFPLHQQILFLDDALVNEHYCLDIHF
jgi:hypothetical protein